MVVSCQFLKSQQHFRIGTNSDASFITGPAAGQCVPDIETRRELPLGQIQNRSALLPLLICQQKLTKQQVNMLINEDVSLLGNVK